MLLLATVLFSSLAIPATLAQDKGKETDEDKAKAAAVAFLKAVKAKDVDAAMKVADVPFLMGTTREKLGLIEKAPDLKADLAAKLGGLKDTSNVPTEIKEVLDLAAIRKKSGEKLNEERFKLMEKAIGDKGYVAFAGGEGGGRGAVLVRIKDGKAAVVGLVD